ncbi:MAG: hypothetical protein WHT29_02675 [Bacteroidales bacterium]|nr:hypothetical protein [Bacteroidales bacterium]HOK98851.1 hypothetical protein [Bacteroidales bacterium]HPO65679.1 hypothetical protein [Bacteroidales bacterium]
MAINTKQLDNLVHDLGYQPFVELFNVFLEDVSEVVEGMHNSLLNNDIAAFQGWAHRGKTTAGTFGIMKLSKKLDYYAHCDPTEITLDNARTILEECEKEFMLAIDEINDYIRTIQKQ